MQQTVRFGEFELDLRAGELRRRGVRLKISGQPVQVLGALLRQPGSVVLREDLRRELWPEDTFVDFDHSLNTSINKLREVLGDSAASPKLIETIPKRGYRFIGAVEHSLPALVTSGKNEVPSAAPQQEPESHLKKIPQPPRLVARTLFGAVQVMYLVFYVLAVMQIQRTELSIEELNLPFPIFVLIVVIVAAAVGIPVRLYFLSSVIFDYRGIRVKFERVFPMLWLLDTLWALAPFLAVWFFGYGIAIAASAALLYLPFSQRTLLRMAYFII